MQKLFYAETATLNESMLARGEAMRPLRAAQPEEIAEVVAFLDLIEFTGVLNRISDGK